MDSETRNTVSIGCGIAVVLLGLGLLLGSFEIVDDGYRGVVRRFGSIQDVPLNPGLNFKMPFLDTVTEWTVQVQSAEVDAVAGTADLQTVKTHISVNYVLVPNLTPQVARNLGPLYATTVFVPALQESLKAVVARYPAAELLSQRDKVSHEIEKTLQDKLDYVLKGALQVRAMNLQNFMFEESFNQAIELKQVAEQEAFRARNEVEKEKAEADKKIEQARGRAESNKLEAQAESDAIRMRARARAEAIQIEAAVLKDNPAILKLRTIEKWDGTMPRVVGKDTDLLLSIGEGK